MFNISSKIRVYLATGYTDMRKGINGLSTLASDIAAEGLDQGALFVFRGKKADRVKILWWDGQGYCLYYKCLGRGKFTWPSGKDLSSVSITKAQLSMLLEGIDWRQCGLIGLSMLVSGIDCCKRGLS